MEQKWVIDYQTSGGSVPEPFLQMIRDLWPDFELGNDHSYIPGDYAEDHPEYDNFVAWLAGEGLKPTDVLLHFWW